MKRTSLVRRTPLTTRTGLTSRTPMPRATGRIAGVSRKHRAQLRTYSTVRAEFMAAHPSCEWCGQLATDLHHRRGRVGADLLDPAHFAALCRPCHQRATVQPAWALSVGLSEPRIGRAS